ncbi:MAG TPA: 30S ribosomal protein S13 [Candidatus Saccharimonadales bacterium]|nr:30S ribosomal protein S13 [Candidatus Saccharimonadales bacterium]
MARIAGITIPNEKQVHTALQYIYGIGKKNADDILDKAKIDKTVRVKNLTDGEISKISEIISNDYVVEGELQRIVTGNIKRLRDINSYRGGRHKFNLPSRGQRTKTNARTRRGKKVTIGGTAKKVPAKT